MTVGAEDCTPEIVTSEIMQDLTPPFRGPYLWAFPVESGKGLQDCRTAGLQDGRTAGLQDCRTAGLQDCRTPGLQDCRTGRDCAKGNSFFHRHR